VKRDVSPILALSGTLFPGVFVMVLQHALSHGLSNRSSEGMRGLDVWSTQERPGTGERADYAHERKQRDAEAPTR
jgi:hypothetical protein